MLRALLVLLLALFLGACVQVEGYEVQRLSDAVIYRDNGVNLEATDLPLPEPSAPALTP